MPASRRSRRSARRCTTSFASRTSGSSLPEGQRLPAWSWPAWFAAWQRRLQPGRAARRLRRPGRRPARRHRCVSTSRRPGPGCRRTSTRRGSVSLRKAPGAARRVRSDPERPPPGGRATAGAGRRRRRAGVPRGGNRPGISGSCDTHTDHVPYVTVGADWQAYARNSPGRKLVRNIQRHRRRLSELGPVSFEWVSPEPGAVDELLADGLRVEGSGWKQRTGSAISLIPNLAAFYLEAGPLGGKPRVDPVRVPAPRRPRDRVRLRLREGRHHLPAQRRL